MSTTRNCSEISQRGYLWTQGAGGNVSSKTEDFLWIKPSGLRLDEIKTDSDLVKVDLPMVREGLRKLSLFPDEKKYSELLVQSVVGAGRRPSMETGFHAVLKMREVAHFHSLVSVLLFHELSKNPSVVKSWYQKRWAPYFGEMCVLPLVMPGLHLSLQLFDRAQEKFVLLQNHGVILQSDDLIDFHLFEEMEKDFCNSMAYSDALQLLNRENEPKESAEIRFLFPDFAIVFDDLFPFLKVADKGYKINPEAPLSLKEIWMANCFLQELKPELEEIPNSFVEELVDLPTEKYRRKKG